MQRNDAIEAATLVVAELKRLGVRYYLCGAVASAFYGTSRSTVDIDLVADLATQHVAPLVRALQDKYYVSATAVLDAIARKSCFNVIYLPANFKVDVFVPKAREYDRVAFQRIREDSLEESSSSFAHFCLPSAEDVVLGKLEWYRLGDEVSDRQWGDVLGVLRVQGTRLDHAYLQKWASELGVADLLAKAQAEAESP